MSDTSCRASWAPREKLSEVAALMTLMEGTSTEKTGMPAWRSFFSQGSMTVMVPSVWITASGFWVTSVWSWLTRALSLRPASRPIGVPPSSFTVSSWA